MLKYLTKFTVDILPSVAATVIGAYIVNHYIVTRPEAPAAAAVSTAGQKAAAVSKPADKPTQVSSLPEAGVKAKGMSERTLIERSASEKAPVIEKPQEKSQDKSADTKSADPKPEAKPAEAKPAEAKPAEAKPADAPAETATLPAEPRRHAPTQREKAVAKVTSAPVAPVAPAAQPVVTAPNPAPVEAAVAPEERRDANGLARAAIERLRGTNDASRPQEPARSETTRIQEAPRVSDTPRVVTAPAIRPLPPPIMVSTPSSETYDQNPQPRPPYAANADDPRRPTPPADIPVPVRQPLDLRAEAAEPARERTTIGEDMLSAAKSVFRRPAEVFESLSK
jgi:hypothetical protein